HHFDHRHHSPMRPRSFSNVCPGHQSNPNPNQSVAAPQIELFKPALPRLPSLSQMLPRGAFPLLAQTLSGGGYSRQGGGGGEGVDGGGHHHKRRRTSYGAFPMDASDGRVGSSATWTLSSASSRRDAGSGVVMVDALSASLRPTELTNKNSRLNCAMILRFANWLDALEIGPGTASDVHPYPTDSFIS
ncbi:13022_t:CDS:2, partial [Acaulospora colombiana]